MTGKNNGQKIFGWITLIILAFFLIIGLGILFGQFLPDKIFRDNGMRVLLGLILVGYSLVRGAFVLMKLRSLKKEDSLNKNSLTS